MRKTTRAHVGFTTGAYLSNATGGSFVEAYTVPLLQAGTTNYAVVGGLRGLTAARGLNAWGSCLTGCLDYSFGSRVSIAFAGIAATMPPALITSAAGVNAWLPALYSAYIANIDQAAPIAGVRLRQAVFLKVDIARAHIHSWLHSLRNMVRAGPPCAVGFGFPNGDVLLVSSCRFTPYTSECSAGTVRARR